MKFLRWVSQSFVSIVCYKLTVIVLRLRLGNSRTKAEGHHPQESRESPKMPWTSTSVSAWRPRGLLWCLPSWMRRFRVLTHQHCLLAGGHTGWFRGGQLAQQLRDRYWRFLGQFTTRRSFGSVGLLQEERQALFQYEFLRGCGFFLPQQTSPSLGRDTPSTKYTQTRPRGGVLYV